MQLGRLLFLEVNRVEQQAKQFYCMNPVSFRTKNQNLLRTKTKSFKDNIKQTEARIRSSSSLNNLAGKLYSPQINKDFATKTPKQDNSNNPNNPNSLNISRSLSTSKLAQSGVNPQMNVALSGLAMRASHVPCFAEINTDLLKEKKMLESRIVSLKEAIAIENRTLSRTDIAAKKNEAGFKNYSDMYNDYNRKSTNLQNQISATTQDNNSLKRDIKTLKTTIQQRTQMIKEETENCNRLETETKNLKLSYMHEEKEKNNLKSQLCKQQKVMNSLSIECKELENQRAMLLVEINHSVKSFKL